MKNRLWVMGTVLSVVALSFIFVACEQQVSSDKTSTVSSDGTVKTKEKTVTRAADGTETKTEETKKTTPPKP